MNVTLPCVQMHLMMFLLSCFFFPPDVEILENAEAIFRP